MAKHLGNFTGTGDHVKTTRLTHGQAVTLIQAHAKRLKKGGGKVPKELLDSKLESNRVIAWALQFVEE